ncbi:hypothetical protein SDC9_151769 [bioreactor metagenome]|uniref:Uncharacterized protein n=1 Tax=bioreactor metagenome TaxID=1076179 RepID=A0A645ER72_9ZZZZ
MLGTLWRIGRIGGGKDVHPFHLSSAFIIVLPQGDQYPITRLNRIVVGQIGISPGHTLKAYLAVAVGATIVHMG